MSQHTPSALTSRANQEMQEIYCRHKNKYPQKYPAEDVRLQVGEYLPVFRPVPRYVED